MNGEKSSISIYLDTSIISAYFDNKNIERQDWTKDFFRILHKFDVYISDITLNEIKNTLNASLRNNMLNLCQKLSVLHLTDNVSSLAQQYVLYKAIPEKYIDDALHIAIAVINHCDYLLNWNFIHIVKVKTREIVRMVNSLNKYRQIDIITPAELVD